MVKSGITSPDSELLSRLSVTSLGLVRPFLLYIVALAGAVACLMVVVHRSCAFQRSALQAWDEAIPDQTQCGVFAGKGGARRVETHRDGGGEQYGPRYTYSDLLWHRVNRTLIRAADREELSAASPHFDFSDQRLRLVTKLVRFYLEPWQAVAGVTWGFGAPRKGWKVATVREAAATSSVMSCCLHVRVVGGVVYFRYGQVLSLPWRLNRANDFVTFLQLTIDKYELKSFKMEFFFNTCDHPLGSRTMFLTATQISNYLILSNHLTDLNTDVLVPDFLDWGDTYMPTEAELASSRERRWEEKISKLVFRGATTNFDMQFGNWGSNPRVKLHRMSDAFPHLLDARISRWSHTMPGSVFQMKRDSIELAPRLNFTEKSAFKYELIVDGSLGTTRLCGVMATDRVVVRQSSPFFQFFDPLLKRGRHFVEVKHNLQDLVQTVEYMQQHDTEMQQVVKNARDEVGWICTPEGRMLAFAVLLVKYHNLLEDAHLVEKPRAEHMCPWGAATKVFVYARNERPDCMIKEEKPILEQPGCPTVCSFYGLQKKDWYWLSSRDLEGWPAAWNISS